MLAKLTLKIAQRFLQTIDAHVKTAVEKITALSNSEVAQLEKDIATLEQKIAQL